ncbi:MerR family transcriptional regulator [Jeotgalibacillus sp. S-D1]|uniref:MerR family transcriptional regulator n=1 Tax=Jeotgalibacillus sp. S-D1 TaxID=2552189 RepID=UPI0010596789|nr:MerR family transcriptional regulator [Jeotgalibacillus sp. S-D1]TDL31544.1 MerR family transcriptional regulator [Jeotgalibacillus sp. S-D1]
MPFKVKEVAEIVGISVRTLHHYDDIGLLMPDEISESGYRLYSDENLETLQQILFFRELDFPLKRIKEILTSPSFDREEALQLHRQMLLNKRNKLDQLLVSIDKTIQHMKGEIMMSNEEKFDGFDFSHNPYEQEARDRWGDQAVDQSKEKIGNLSKVQQQNMKDEMEDLYNRMAAIRHLPPNSKEAQSLTHEWFTWLNTIGSYSLEAFKGLGEMYVNDERFTSNIDKFGDGLAAFLNESMTVYANKRK